MVAQSAPSSPFGSQARTKALVALSLVAETYPRELARLLDVPLFSVQKALASMERDGLVSCRTLGRIRLYSLNPRYPASRELREYLERLAGREFELRRKVASLARRP